jgi:hypothetical protein
MTEQIEKAVGVPCPAPELQVKDAGSDGTKAFFWVNPPAPCAKFYARATAHPDPENAPPESFEILQPTISSRTATFSAVRTGMVLLGPVTQSVLVRPTDPWTGVELFQNVNDPTVP